MPIGGIYGKETVYWEAGLTLSDLMKRILSPLMMLSNDLENWNLMELKSEHLNHILILMNIQ